MKTTIILRSFLFLVLLLNFFDSNSQVTGVKYMMKYDPKNDYFDCFLIITDGFAKNLDQRTQFPSQVGIVVPSGTEFKVKKTYMPLYQNQNFNSTRPVDWEISAKIGSPNAQKRNDFYKITPNLSIDAHYNSIDMGDTIKLFSLAMDTLVGCADGIRLFINGTDPTPDAVDFLNIDFSQKFALGSPDDDYTQNYVLNYPSIAGKDENACKGSSINLGPFPYTKGSWYLPSGNPFGAQLDSFGFGLDKVLFSLKAKTGIFTLVYQDSNYYDMKCITITAPKAEITVDSVSCNGGFMEFIASGGVFYKWSNNATTSTIRPKANSTYTVTVTDVFGCTASASTATKTLTDIIVPGQILCLGSTYTLPDFRMGTWDTLLIDGNWISNSPGIAVVSKQGVVTPLAPGDVNFTFVYGSCFVTSEIFKIRANPTVAFMGPNEICVSGTTSLSPMSGGQWSSSNPLVATVNSAGLVVGLSPGVTTLKFTDANTGCSSVLVSSVVVKAKPAVAITGPGSICVGSITNLSPNAGGTWISDNIIVASVTNNGIVTGLIAGSAQFRFLAANGCFSDLTPPVNVLPKPQVSITGNDHICVGGNTTLSPNTGGTWSSSNGLVLTVSNSGLVTGISAGIGTLVFTSSFGCISDPTFPITVSPKPGISITGLNKICVGSTTTLLSSTSGSWVSNAPFIASISPNGLITGLSAGNASFTFTDGLTGCNAVSGMIEVLPTPSISSGDLDICLGSELTLSPSLNGTWQASPTGIILISNQTFSTITTGNVKLIFTAALTGCTSDSINLTVHSIPAIQLLGNDTICVGGSTTFISSEAGTWAGSNFSIADITNAGIVNGFSPGAVFFQFTSANGCAALSQNIIVKAPDIVNIGIQNNQLVTPNIASSYKWYSCPDNQLIATTTTPGFQPLQNGIYKVVIDDGICLSSSGCIDYVVASTYDSWQKEIVLFPNPTKDIIQIKSPWQIVNLKLTNGFGQLLFKCQNECNNIDVSSFITGVYFVEIETVNGNLKKIFIKL